jgi:hypothetical protein
VALGRSFRHLDGKHVFQSSGLKTLNSSTLADFPLVISYGGTGVVGTIVAGFLSRKENIVEPGDSEIAAADCHDLNIQPS